jgi:hypothetical protein
MTILELHPYDLNLVSPAYLAAGRDLWAKLPDLVQGLPTARLLMVASSFSSDDVLNGFRQQAIPAGNLPPLVAAYRTLFEQHIGQEIQSTRYMRLFLVINLQQAEAAGRLLAHYGLRATPLTSTIPTPFTSLENQWNRGVGEDGQRWAMVQSQAQQTGRLSLTYLHNLLNVDFPIWISLELETLPKAESMSLLRRKATSARFERSADLEARAEAQDVSQIAQLLRAEIQNAGMALHHMRLSVLVGGHNESQLQERLHVVRSTCGLDLETWETPIEQAQEMFAPTPPVKVAGSLVTTRGLLAAVGSPLTYKRRTVTNGVLVGSDLNNAPVIFNLFDPSHPSYNAILLGQTGSGKTFAFQLMALRHLLLGCRLIMVDPQGNLDWSFLGDDVCQMVRLGTAQSQLNVLDIIHNELPQQIEGVLSRLRLLEVYDPQESLARPILDRVLTEMYTPIWALAQAGQAGLTPTLPQLKARLEQMAEEASGQSAIRHTAHQMAYRLSRYTEGSQADLFGHHSNVDFSLSHPVTIFDVSALPSAETEGNLRAALLSILVGGTSQAIRRLRKANNRAPIIWFVDEFGVLMRDAVVASHVSYEFKTARARLVSMVIADQTLPSLMGQKDALGTAHGELMFGNAAVSLIFFQREGERQHIRHYYPELPLALEERIYHQGLGQCVLQLPHDTLQMTVKASEFERILLSSRLQDKERRLALISKLRQQEGGQDE